MNHRVASLLVLALGFTAAHCSATVGPGDSPDVVVTDDARPSDPSTPDAAPPPPPARSCDEVRAACGPAPQQFVRGHAAGLTGLEGARARFAVRYQGVAAAGIAQQHGVAVGEARVQDGAFEACVCIPYGGSWYPEIAAVVFAPGTTGETSRDVARAMYSQRYATLGDENVGGALAQPATAAQAETALAALVDRVQQVTLGGLAPDMEGAQLYAGLVADERPVAAQVVGARVASSAAQLTWSMPGRAWPSERIVMLVDRNQNHRCDAADIAWTAPLDGRTELGAASGTWSEGTALDAACTALSIEQER